LKIYSLLVLTACILHACVEQSPTDPRIFHCEILDNGLSIVLVEDPAARESAAAMHVRVGSEDDPQGIEGLAHFLEHMLFISTEEYPEIDALSHYVSTHGGGYNAFTTREYTQYFFHIQPDNFTKGLDIFSAFFIAPLFSEEYVERERHAVHAEFKMHQKEDRWRQYYVDSLTSNLEHPANRFTIGNLDTLSERQPGALRQALVKFYDSHYSADNMYFVAVTPDPIAQHLPSIKARLSQIPNRDVFKRVLPHRWDRKSLSRFIHFKNLRDVQSLEVSFLLPSQKEYYLSPATSYIASLMGDEGEGSILENLKLRGWATALSVQSHPISEIDEEFSISINLTKDGYRHIDEILAAVMSDIDLIRYQGVGQERFQEMQKISYLHYLFYKQQSVESQVNQLAGRMADFPNRMLAKVGYISDESVFDAGHIYRVLDHLRLDNARVWLIGPDEPTDITEPIFGASYKNRSITIDEAVKWLRPSDFALKLPEKNGYIPNDIHIKSLDEQKWPEKIGPGVWYLPDSEFLQPKQYINAKLVTKPITDIVDNMALQFVTSLLHEAVIAKLYPATTAGMGWSISTDLDGLSLSVWGMGDAQQQVMQVLISSLEALKHDIPETLFAMVKQSGLESLSQLEYSAPARLLGNRLQALLLLNNYSQEATKDAISNMTVEQVRHFITKYLDEVLIKSFYYGNIAKEEIDGYQPKFETSKSLNTVFGKSKKVIKIYTKDQCSYCDKAKMLLRHRGLSFEEIELGSNSEQILALVEKTGMQALPHIFIKDQLIGGYDDLKFMANSGKLDDHFTLSGQQLESDPNLLIRVPSGESLFDFHTMQKDYAMLAYYQLENNSYRDKALAMLLSDMMSASFFEQLRTEEQIGYIVRCSYWGVQSWPAIGFIVQSPHMQPINIKERMQMFLSMGSFWNEEQFEAIQKSTIYQYEDPFTTMGEVNGFYWRRIANSQLNFDSREKMIEALKLTSYADVKELSRTLFTDDARLLLLMANQSGNFNELEVYKQINQQNVISSKTND
jgi:insulysin